MREFGLESLSSSQVSRAAKLLDGELDAWRNRPLGEIRYLLLDARYEKVREGGVVRDAAVLSVIGIDQRRRVLGVSCALSCTGAPSDPGCPWHGVAYIVHRPRRRAQGRPAAVWQRCQYHLAIHHEVAIERPSARSCAWIGKAAEAELGHLVAAYRDSAPKLADWLETAIPEGLAVSRGLPERHKSACEPRTPWSDPSSRRSSIRTVNQGLSQRGLAHRHPRRNRREMGNHRKTLRLESEDDCRNCVPDIRDCSVIQISLASVDIRVIAHASPQNAPNL